MKSLSIKAQLIAFLALLAVSLSLVDKDAAFLFLITLALISAMFTEAVFNYLINRKFTISESSIISALIIAFVLSSDNPWWVIVLTGVLAISSKYLIRINKKHIFNPAAFGIFLSMFLFGATTQWRGTYLWYILVPVGLYLVYKIRKIELLASYAVTAVGLFAIQALVQKTPILNIFGYLSYFYIFIMTIEPKTTSIKLAGKVIFGASLAVLIFIFTEMGANFDPELAALLMLNMFVPLLNKI